MVINLINKVNKSIYSLNAIKFMNIRFFDKKLLISLLVFLLLPLVWGLDFPTMEHEATVTLSPNISSCNIPTKFTVNITNNAGYGIYNVKIYKAQTNILNITCGPAPTGWNFRGFQYGQYCEYDTDPSGSYVINPGESLMFTFSATLIQTDCVTTLMVSTLDNGAIVGEGQGKEETHNINLSVDCHAPKITKIVDTAKKQIKFFASDDGQCDLGMDYCRYRIIFDDSPGAWNVVSATNRSSITWQYSFQNDSINKVEVECYDIAGNKAVLNETLDSVPGEIIVVFDESAMMLSNSIVGSCGGSIIDKSGNAVLVRVPEGTEASFINKAMKIASVRYVERNGIVRALWTPNDADWKSQWGPTAISADKAWDIVKGSKNVKIAIIDTGIDYNHEDLRDNYDDSGYDWVNNDDDPMDDHGHGTHCAGIAAAVMDNGVGIAGIAQVKIMAEKVLDRWGYGTYWSVGLGIEHAVDHGADIISMSIGGSSYSRWLEDKCNDAWDKGVILVAAAGNRGSERIDYPAAYDSVIAVGATDRNNRRTYYSNYGDKLELVAPGDSIYSTLYPDTYGTQSGTSMATPHVAGVAALMLAANSSLSNEDVRKILHEKAVDLGASGKDKYYGYGLVDAYQSVLAVAKMSGSISGEVLYTNNQSGIPDVNVSLIKDGDIIRKTKTNEKGRFLFENLSEGNYTINVSKPRFFNNVTTVSVIAGKESDVSLVMWRKGDLNNNGKSADAGDVSLMLKGSVLIIEPDWRYDLNNNGKLADAADVLLILKASVGYIDLI